MWFGSGQAKTHIEEANRHLSELYKKISDLEEQLNTKTKELADKERDYDIVMQEIHEKRQLEIQELNTLIYQQNLKLKVFERDLANRDSELAFLRKRCRMFDEVLRYKATLGKLTITMEQSEQFAMRSAEFRGPAYNRTNELDGVNTEPAPLMIHDVSFNGTDPNVPFSSSDSRVLSNGLPESKRLCFHNEPS